MTDATVLDISRRALVLALTVVAPVLGVGLVVGLVVAVFQAATQIHEMTLTFIPKILAVAVVVAVCGPWMLQQLVAFSGELLRSIPYMVR
ncbi:MAG: flagellar biosynthesis protein FliQ [Armatimonadetes bacterium]|nr:flagellar biosynthesis protein FliQ [Armatimonadota bacterium]